MLDTLDLCTSLRSQSDCSPSASQGIGWLSPRISFSAGVVDKSSAERIGSGKDDPRSGEDRALDFEFCMGSSSLDPVSGGCMLSADELFHKGKLLPQSLPSSHPQQDTVSVSFSGPLDTMKTPFVNVDWSPQRPSVSKSGPLGREELGFPGPETTHARYSGPLDMRHVPPSRYSGPLSFANATSSCGVSVDGTGKPKSQTWEKVIGLLRRARSDSHRDRLYPSRDQTVPSRKQSSGPMPKNSGSAASSLRLIFRRNSSTEKSGKAIPSDTCSSSHLKSSVAKFSPSEPCAMSSPPAPPPFPSAPVQVASSKPSGLAALHVASPIYPTSSASETGRDVESDLWTSSATEVDLRPATERESWRMLETESSLEITFDRFDKPPAGEIKKKVLDRSAGTTPTATNPSRIVLKNLERCSNPASKVGKGQEQLRALRTREIRRSPERLASYTSSVRVTPVLNVPVCIAPTMRSSKAAKGRLASLRSLLSFKKEKDERTFSDPVMAA